MMPSISSAGLNARRPVTATKSCRLRSSSDWPDGNQPVEAIAPIRALLNRSDFDPSMGRSVSVSDGKIAGQRVAA